jgi:hypothetical protein
MNIDFTPFLCRKEAITLILEKLGDLGLRTRFTMFHIAPLAAGVVLQTASCGLESAV